MGNLVVEHVSAQPGEDFAKLTLSADRGVIFTRPGTVTDLARNELSAEFVEGIYLEGNVTVGVDDGDYTARAPKVSRREGFS